MPNYSITKNRGKFHLTWNDGAVRRRYSLDTSDRAEAETRAPARYAELTRPKNLSIGGLWLAYVEENADKPIATTMGYTWRSLEARFGTREPHSISLADCLAHTVSRQKNGISDGTIHTELGHLRTVMNWAVKRRLIESAPYIQRPSKPEPKDGFLTREEAQRMLSATYSDHVRLAMQLMLTTGARVGAITGLTWDRVDFERKIINLRDPTLKGRRKGRATLPMNESIMSALKSAKLAALTEYVIEYAGRPVVSLKKGIKTTGIKIGRPDLSAHMLRHTAAVWLAEDGHSMDEIAQYLGHSNSRITAQIYARYSPGHLRKLSATLEI